MGYKVTTSDVRLEDIIPKSRNSDINDSILSVTDIIISADKINKVAEWNNHSSFEYDFVLNVDIEKAFTKKVTGLEVTLSNEDGKKFTSTIHLSKEIGSTIDKGENDLEAFLREVKKIRKIQTSLKSTPTNKVKSLSEGFSFHASAGPQNGSTAMKNLVSQGKFNLDTALPGKINNKIYENKPSVDFYVKPPKVETDGFNSGNGISLSKIKEDIIAKELAEGKYEQSSMFSNVLTALEPDYEQSQSEEDIYILKYSSTIVPIRRLLRINAKTVSPFADILIGVRPILDDSVETHASKSRNFKINLANDISSFYIPAGIPDFIITAQAPGYITMTARKNDPTLSQGKIVIDYLNPTNPSQIIESKEKLITFTQSVVSFSMSGIHNVEPLIARATFYTMTSNGNIVRSKSTNLKPHKSAVSYMMPNVKNHNDSMYINGFSTNEGIRITLEGEIEGAYKLSIFREDLTVPKSDSMRLKKVFETLDFANNSFLDTNVARDRVYRYYAEYTRKTLRKSSPIAGNIDENKVRLPGQGLLGLTSHKSVNHTEVKYKKSKILTGISVDDPFISQENNRPCLNISLKHDVLKQDINTEDILNRVQNTQAADLGKLGLTKNALLTKIPAVIVERINRINQEEQSLGVVFLKNSGETLIKDKLLYTVGSSALNMSGRYTYKFKICQPTIGGLYNVPIPIENAGPGLSRQEYKVNALKYTANIFSDQGTLPGTLANLDYISLIKSFDTGERIYKNYDPYEFSPPSGVLSKTITLNVTEKTNGHRVMWKTPASLLQIIDFYLIYKSYNGKKTLVGSIKGGRNNTSYEYYDVNTYILSKFLLKPVTAYSIVGVTKDGEMLPSTKEVSAPGTNNSGIVKAAEMITKTNGVILI
jgi:hypothetical protein